MAQQFVSYFSLLLATNSHAFTNSTSPSGPLPTPTPYMTASPTVAPTTVHKEGLDLQITVFIAVVSVFAIAIIIHDLVRYANNQTVAAGRIVRALSASVLIGGQNCEETSLNPFFSPENARKLEDRHRTFAERNNE